MRITAPNPQFTGTVAGVDFTDGVAEVDELAPAARAYLKRRGYGLDGADPEEPAGTPEPPDPRTVGDATAGTTLRDGAVNPEPQDYRGPTNAGEANPHGPLVVNPGIHDAPGGVTGDVERTPSADGSPVPVEDPAAVEVPDGNVDEIVAWVDGDPARAKAALTAEDAREKPRSTLRDQLAPIAGTA